MEEDIIDLPHSVLFRKLVAQEMLRREAKFRGDEAFSHEMLCMLRKEAALRLEISEEAVTTRVNQTLLHHASTLRNLAQEEVSHVCAEAMELCADIIEEYA